MLNRVGNRGHQVNKQIRKNVESFWKYQGRFSCFTHADRDDHIHQTDPCSNDHWPAAPAWHAHKVTQPIQSSFAGDPATQDLLCSLFQLGSHCYDFSRRNPQNPHVSQSSFYMTEEEPMQTTIVCARNQSVGCFFFPLKIWRTAAAKVAIAFILCSWYWYSYYITAVPHMTTRNKILYKSQHVW